MFATHEINVLQVYIHSYGCCRQAHSTTWRTSGNLVKIDGHLEIYQNQRDAINEVASVIDRVSDIREYSSGAKLFSTIRGSLSRLKEQLRKIEKKRRITTHQAIQPDDIISNESNLRHINLRYQFKSQK